MRSETTEEFFATDNADEHGERRLATKGARITKEDRVSWQLENTFVSLVLLVAILSFAFLRVIRGKNAFQHKHSKAEFRDPIRGEFVFLSEDLSLFMSQEVYGRL